jgi:hypothetical protein
MEPISIGTWIVFLILLPLLILLWATESKITRINRLRKQGQTWKQIGERYGVSPTTARRWATA